MSPAVAATLYRKIILLSKANTMIPSIKHTAKALLLLLIPVVFVQCEKDEPSTEAKLKTTLALFSNAAMQGKLTINEAFIALDRIDIEANSATGSQSVLSSSNTNENPQISLLGSGETPFEYKLTQGKYDPINFVFYPKQSDYQLKTITTEGGDNIPDFADFLQNADPTMVLSGTFSNRGQVVRVYVSIDLNSRLSFNALQLGQTSISVGRENVARITVDPSYVLQDLSVARLEGASTFNYQGQPTILIHPNYNRTIYLDIENRLFDTSRVFKGEIIQVNSNG